MDNDPRERREHARAPFREDILVDGTMKATSVDISEGGLYICTIQPFGENSVIEVTIPYRGRSFTVKAQVQYSQVGIGMGVRFLDITNEQRRILKELAGVGSADPVPPQEKEYRILFVEENDISRQYENKLLAEGFYVIGAKDVVEAMRILREQTPDLIIIDLYMKKMDGFKVLSILKTTPKWKELPVIVCSTSDREDVMKKVIDAGADEFLNKMVTPASQLVDIVNSVLRRGH